MSYIRLLIVTFNVMESEMTVKKLEDYRGVVFLLNLIIQNKIILEKRK